jgi:WD40 repeat protein
LPGTGNVVTWSPDGEKIATSYGGGMQTWSAKNAQREQVYEIPARDFGWDKKTGELVIMTATEVLLQNITEEKKPRKFEIAAADTVMWTPGRPLVSGLSDKTARFWDTATGKPLAELSGHTEKILAAAWSNDGKLFATGSSDMTAKVWDGKTGKLLRSLAGANKPVKGVAWSTDGKLATASEDKIVRVYPANSDKPLELTGHTHPVAAVAWSRDGKLVSGGEDGKVIFWDATGKSTKSLEIDHDVMALAFSPDGNALAVGSNDDSTRIFSATGGAMPLKTLSGQNGAAEFFNLSWSPDGSLIATTNYRMQLWNPKSDKMLHGFHIAGAVNNIAWTPDGRTTAGGCLDRAVRFCDTATGRLRGTMICDDKQVVTVSGDGHFKAASDLEPELVYVGQSDKALETLDLKAFQAKYGWKNNPVMVKVLGN